MQQTHSPAAHDGGPVRVNAATGSGTPLLFLILVLIFSLPFYLIAPRRLFPQSSLSTSVGALMVLVPLTVAIALTYKESGWTGVRRLVARAFDIHKVRPALWFLPALLLLPIALWLAYFVSRMLGHELGAMTPLWESPGSTLLFFVVVLIPFAIAEELGWMAYAADPLKARWGTGWAILIISVVWAAWHWYPWYRIHGTIEWVVWQSLVTVMLRALMFWMYNCTGGAVCLAVIFHATFNISYRLFPDQGAQYDALATTLVLGVVTALVMAVWGRRVLAA